ncbi:hypothetical protein CTheo_8278 [Ceratobasidium theobromae]|uniref:Uncharacterized protein n=1 Tax=Ceratobasidium theobromae TaxID=1582974 RepID=A0A5N5Q9I3_9AGAM|nr:hypothetical protein CTheo_8278 [Ceratobasidium theobromae]
MHLKHTWRDIKAGLLAVNPPLRIHSMFITPQKALSNARDSSFYLGLDTVPNSSTWVTAFDDKLDVAVAAPPDGSSPDPSTPPAVFSGIFQIMPSMFFLEPDMSIDADHPAQWQADMGLEAVFAEGRGSCMLAPVPVTYPELNAEYRRYLANIDAVMKKALPRVTQSGFRVFDNDAKISLKMFHRLYERRPACMVSLSPTSPPESASAQDGKKRTNPDDGDDASDTEGIIPITELDKDVLPEFRICNLPVAPNCKPFLDKIVATHLFNPLHAFDGSTGNPLRPIEYGPKLRGAIAEVRFTLSHKIIKTRKAGVTSHFTATIDEIFVLGMPSELSLAPSKVRNKKLFGMNSASTSKGTTDKSAPGPLNATTDGTVVRGAKRSRK